MPPATTQEADSVILDHYTLRSNKGEVKVWIERRPGGALWVRSSGAAETEMQAISGVFDHYDIARQKMAQFIRNLIRDGVL